MTSRPLFIRVDESTVIFGSHRPGRVGQRLRHSDGGQLLAGPAPERPARGGEQQTAPPRRRRPARRHWWTAQCSESTGMISAPGRGPGPLHHRGTGDDRLLVGQGQPAAGLEGGQGHGQSGEAHHPVDGHVGHGGDGGQPLGARHHLDAGGQGPRQLDGRVPCRRWPPPRDGGGGPGRPAARPSDGPRGPATRNRSGAPSMTSRAWVPMEPVDPTRLTVTGARPKRRSETPRRPLNRADRGRWAEVSIPLACPKFSQYSGHGPGSRWPGARTTGRRPGRGRRRGRGAGCPCPSAGGPA